MEIEKFDPSKMMDGVKDRIKATFASLVPDDAWDQMVKSTVHKYFHEKDYGNNYTDRYKYTQFDLLVFTLLEEETRKRLAEYLKSEGYATAFSTYAEPVIGAKVEKLFIENSGQILFSLLGNTFQDMLNRMAIDLQNSSNRSY